eukprot:SAG31_NODE_13566_length_861_cov_0.654856_1_plen_28_part_10
MDLIIAAPLTIAVASHLCWGAAVDEICC